MLFQSTITIFLILSFIIKGFKYKKSSYLTCGQWGYIGDTYDPKALGILGLFNQSRGVHSCGTYVDGKVIKGVDDEALWMDFIVKHPYPQPEELESDNKVVMGHARQASSGFGKHTAANQHPFEIGNLIGQQNGTLKNEYPLQAKYGITRNEWDVDTQLLYTIMDRHGLDVLEQYEGAAALMWAKANTPNELYVFKGASPYNLPKDERYFIERPLYFLREENGVYFSSMWNSLEFIRKNPEHEIAEVPHNQVFKLYFDKKGKVKWRIERNIVRDLTQLAKSYIKPVEPGNVVPPIQRILDTGEKQILKITIMKDMENGGLEGNTKILDFSGQLKKSSALNYFSQRNINVERCFGKKLAYRNGRYYCDEFVVNGIFRVDFDGVVLRADKVQLEPKGVVCYFFAGIMLKDRETYNRFMRNPWKSGGADHLKKSKHYFKRYAFSSFEKEPQWIMEISLYSKYPVKVMPENCSNPEFEEKWYQNSQEATDLIICPLFTEFRWYYKDGNLLAKTLKDPERDIQDVLEVVDIEKIYRDENSDCDQCELDFKASVLGGDYSSFEEITAEDLDKDIPKTSPFDQKYKSVDEFLNNLTIKKLSILHYYLDRVWNLGDIDHLTPREIKVMVFSGLERCVRNKTTIKDEMQENAHGTLEQYESEFNKLDIEEEFRKTKLVRVLYYEECALAFQKMEIEDQMFNDEETEECDDTITSSCEDIVSCCANLEYIELDLEKYADNPKATALKELVQKNNDSLTVDIKEFIQKEMSHDDRLLKKI